MKKIETTLLVLRKDDEILLAMKKRGFGAGKYNGVGGKKEIGETFDEAMLREAYEEISVTPTEYVHAGIMNFIEIVNGEKVNLEFYLYVASSWVGTPTESEEVRPEWFKIDEIPYDMMFVDDRYWLPLILEDKKVKCFFEFDEDWNLLEYKIEDLNNPHLIYR